MISAALLGLILWGVLAAVQAFQPSPQAKLSATLDRIALQSEFGARWEDLGPQQQEYLRRKIPAVYQAELIKRTEAFQKEQVGTSEAMQKEQLRIAKEIRSALPPDVGKGMDALNMRVILTRKSGDWYMNDARYKQYQNLVTSTLQKVLPGMFASPKYQQLPFEVKQKELQRILNDVREQARDYIKAQADQTQYRIPAKP